MGSGRGLAATQPVDLVFLAHTCSNTVSNAGLPGPIWPPVGPNSGTAGTTRGRTPTAGAQQGPREGELRWMASDYPFPVNQHPQWTSAGEQAPPATGREPAGGRMQMRAPQKDVSHCRRRPPVREDVARRGPATRPPDKVAFPVHLNRDGASTPKNAPEAAQGKKSE